MSCPCSERKPRCESGIKLYKRMTARYLENGLQVDEKHRELWQRWQEHHVKS